MHFLTPADLRGLDARALEDLLGRRDAVIAMGEGSITGLAAAALLFADYSVLREGATIELDVAEGWAGAAWRLGRAALRLHLSGRTSFDASDGLCDEVTALDAATWFEQWMRGRSELALDSAAMLIRSRGGDALERAEFARLFAIGEPQRGLGAFLARKRGL